ncbi:MAG: hypothetical protein SFU87_04450 [Chitinophagaceae bacterium]|nr:hypothetical protein [Chitinophagaceae bacterium]
MKSGNLHQWSVLLLFVLILTSCSRSNYPERNPYPQRNPHPRGPVVIVDGDGRVITHPGHLPPGQAKKIYGHKSAKVFAPGQKKKYLKHYGSLPAIVIYLPERMARRESSGRWFYRNENDFLYWKRTDGYYHLDDRYFDDGDYRYSRHRNDNDEDERKYKKGKGKWKP